MQELRLEEGKTYVDGNGELHTILITYVDNESLCADSYLHDYSISGKFEDDLLIEDSSCNLVAEVNTGSLNFNVWDYAPYHDTDNIWLISYNGRLHWSFSENYTETANKCDFYIKGNFPMPRPVGVKVVTKELTTEELEVLNINYSDKLFVSTSNMPTNQDAVYTTKVKMVVDIPEQSTSQDNKYPIHITSTSYFIEALGLTTEIIGLPVLRRSSIIELQGRRLEVRKVVLQINGSKCKTIYKCQDYDD